ncbi:major capsid protein [Labrys sp. ZIDIC5]|uniref:major capsid protein n=1 Tax=Labrys sedimenti TaxID=3106036 RepID=UPI002ACA881D|nr:major capsid protein [Labrys sp. ZIDIC5]MDZ5454895.1 major capsid protein [Labrys sp. ZIDIC5]
MQLIRKVGLVAATALAFCSAAHAELPASATAATTSAAADAATLGGIVLGIIIGIAAFKWIRKAL